MNYYLYICFFLLSTNVASAQKTLDALLQQYNTRSIPYISVEELRQQQLNGGLVVLDSREIWEYEVSHLEGAICVGFDFFDASEISTSLADGAMKNLPLDTPIVVYCSLGIRSEEIGEKLKKAGYQNVRNLYGGIFEWKNNEYPILNSSEKETDSVHTFSKAWGKWLNKGIKVYKP